MFNFHRVLRPFAGFVSTLVMCVSVAAEDCPDLMDVHNLFPRIDNQISGQDTLAYSDGPLKPNKSGDGFVLREPLFSELTCKANPLYRDRKNCLEFRGSAAIESAG